MSACDFVNGARELPKELREILSDIVHDANRTSDIVARIRALAKKSIPEENALTTWRRWSRRADARAGQTGRTPHRSRTEWMTTPAVSGIAFQLQQVLLSW